MCLKNLVLPYYHLNARAISSDVPPFISDISDMSLSFFFFLVHLARGLAIFLLLLFFSRTNFCLHFFSLLEFMISILYFLHFACLFYFSLLILGS